ncbi:unnamed protein product [Arctogadus glacialis]
MQIHPYRRRGHAEEQVLRVPSRCPKGLEQSGLTAFRGLERLLHRAPSSDSIIIILLLRLAEQGRGPELRGVLGACLSRALSASRRPLEPICSRLPSYVSPFPRPYPRSDSPQEKTPQSVLVRRDQAGLPRPIPKEVANYPNLKAAILVRYGYSLPGRAQRLHTLAYDPAPTARTKVAALTRVTTSWLAKGHGPPVLERVVFDRCIQALPETKRYSAQTSLGLPPQFWLGDPNVTKRSTSKRSKTDLPIARPCPGMSGIVLRDR